MATMRWELEMLKRRHETMRQRVRSLDDQLHQAAAVQRDLLCSAPPRVEGLDIQTLYRPAQSVSGDVYDVTRLDDVHVAISLADVTGHGLPAALLTAYVKRGLRGAETLSGQTHRLEPDDVLARLNLDILEARLDDCQFATAIHAVYNERSRVIRWARGGAPYPILGRRGEAPRHIKSEGPIVGVIPEARFDVVETRLRPGDTLVLHTDGLDALLLNKLSGLGPCDLPKTDWFQSLGSRPTKQLVDDLEGRLAAMKPDAWEADDLSAVILHVH
jgi:sigma-B regulation protein RsbU (phosphoserine phosphatase)